MDIKDKAVRERLSHLHVLLSQLWLDKVITQGEFLTKLRGLHHAVSGWQTNQNDRHFILGQLAAVESDLRAELKRGREDDRQD